MKKFKLGDIYITRKIDEKMQSDIDFTEFVGGCIARYANQDWGDTCAEDKQLNDEAVSDGERVLGVYIYPKNKKSIWIITEWDRSVTTILFPEEY